MDIIENNLDKPWVYSQVSSNNNVKKHLDKDWCWYSLSRRIAVRDNFDLPWVWDVVKIDSWETVRNNINVPWDDICNNPQLPWVMIVYHQIQILIGLLFATILIFHGI